MWMWMCGIIVVSLVSRWLATGVKHDDGDANKQVKSSHTIQAHSFNF